MALVRCPDCGKKVSDLAVACPECARPIAAVIQEQAAAKAQGQAGAKPAHLRPLRPIPSPRPPREGATQPEVSAHQVALEPHPPTSAGAPVEAPKAHPEAPKPCVTCGIDTSKDPFRIKRPSGEYQCIECKEDDDADRETRKMRLRALFIRVAAGALVILIVVGVIVLVGNPHLLDYTGGSLRRR